MPMNSVDRPSDSEKENLIPLINGSISCLVFFRFWWLLGCGPLGGI